MAWPSSIHNSSRSQWRLCGGEHSRYASSPSHRHRHAGHHSHSETLQRSVHVTHNRQDHHHHHRHPHHQSHDASEDFAERRTHVTHPANHDHSHAGHDDHGEDFAERRSRSRWSLRSQACNTSLPLPRQHCHHSVSTLSTLNTLSILDTLNTSNTLIILKSTGFTERALGRVQARATEHGKTGKTGKGKPELSSQEENGGDEKGEHKDKKLQRHKDKCTQTQRKRQKYRDTKQKKVKNENTGPSSLQEDGHLHDYLLQNSSSRLPMLFSISERSKQWKEKLLGHVAKLISNF